MRKLSPLLLCAMLVPSVLPAVEIVAHRGASQDAPENTLASFRLGWEQGANACELDIHQTQDGHLVVMHDANTKRTAGVDALISAQTTAELRALSAGAWKGAAWADEKIPLLSEVLAIIPEHRQLFIEIKDGPEVVPELCRVITASGQPAAKLVIISFHLAAVRAARAQLPEVEAYLLVSAKPEKGSDAPVNLASFVAQAREAKLTGLDLDYRLPLDASSLAQLKAAGLKTQVWTVDDPAVAQNLAALGVQGITTNRPAYLRAQLSQAALKTP